MTHKRLKSLYGCRHGCLCVFVSTRLLLRTYVGWTTQCNVTPVLVTKPLLRLLFMPSPSAASENVVSAAHCQCPCMSNIKRARRRLDTCLIQCVSHAAVKRCSALVSVYNTMVHQGNKTMHGARRPTARPLYPGRCVSYDIAISRYEMPRYID